MGRVHMASGDCCGSQAVSEAGLRADEAVALPFCALTELAMIVPTPIKIKPKKAASRWSARPTFRFVSVFGFALFSIIDYLAPFAGCVGDLAAFGWSPSKTNGHRRGWIL